jgi:dCMP deaminase
MNRNLRTKYWKQICADNDVDNISNTWDNMLIERDKQHVDENIITNNEIFSPSNRKLPPKGEKKRPSWDEYFKEIVKTTSTRSPCERLRVGCVFVKDNRIISQGYNGFLPDCPHTSIVRGNHEQATLHAEQNVIADCAKRGVSCRGCTAYITHYPCIICCRLLLAAEISEIKYIDDYKNDELVEVFLKQCGVIATKI